jgi:four helix bundle protein
MKTDLVKVLEPQKGDALQRMRVYRTACELLPECFRDAKELAGNEITAKVSAQLYTAVGSIAANLAEGYAHSSGKDRARIFEYALGSARESTSWYIAAKPVLGSEVVDARLAKLDEIRRMLLAIIPRERDRLIRPRKN